MYLIHNSPAGLHQSEKKLLDLRAQSLTSAGDQTPSAWHVTVLSKTSRWKKWPGRHVYVTSLR